MLALERHRRILDLVAHQGSIRTTEVARQLGVTEETVRRDFEKLEQEGQLLRAHGGAARVDSNYRDLPLSSRESENIAEKKIIATLALTHIEPGDVVLFDASSTVFELAKLLPEMSLTVVTSALKVAVELANRPSMHVVLTGGVLSRHSLSCEGHLAGKALDYYHIQKAFISCRGIDQVRGISEANEKQAQLKQQMIACADKVFLMADHSKIGLQSSFFSANNSEIDTFITDRKPDTTFQKALKASNTTLIHPQNQKT